MKNNVINTVCPKCKKSISIDIDNVLRHQVEGEMQKEFELKEKAIKNELENNNQIILAKKEQELTKQVKNCIEKESKDERRLLEEQLKEARQNEVNLIKGKQKLKDDIAASELRNARQLNEERKMIEEEASKKATEAKQSVIDQMAKQISDATKANEELKRKLEQGSQQTQGEIQEIRLEKLLKNEFIYDNISPVSKGINGADVIQIVKTKTGIECGKIIWESKNTKSWTKGWIQKLKDDQRSIGAELAVIVSSVLPEGVENSAFKDGVWICNMKSAISIATALRYALENVSSVKRMMVGKNSNKEILFKYVTSTAFIQKVQTIAETFTSMNSDLIKERNVQEKIWIEREKQIKKIRTNIVDIVVDLNETVPLQKIDFLELPEPPKNKK